MIPKLGKLGMTDANTSAGFELEEEGLKSLGFFVSPLTCLTRHESLASKLNLVQIKNKNRKKLLKEKN